MHIFVMGPHVSKPKNVKQVINTTSRSPNSLWTQLSPFHLGPVKLWGGHRSLNMENAWQYSKVYKSHLHGPGLEAWLKWAKAGWDNPKAVRYPMGKGAQPEFSFWNGLKLDYREARCKIYIPL